MSAPNSANSAKINVLISDGRTLMREGIATLLERDKNIRIVGEAENAQAAAKLLAPLGAHIVLLILPGGGVLVRGLVEADVAILALVTLVNLRGTVESGRAFAAPISSPASPSYSSSD